MNTSVPDITNSDKSAILAPLHKVGMSKVKLPVRVMMLGEKQRVAAECDLFVSLDTPDQKGIHMSRLYLRAKEYLEANTLSLTGLSELAQSFIDSQEGISQSAYISVTYTHMVQVPSLKSDNTGYREYLTTYAVSLTPEDGLVPEIDVTVTYSSTCPCSAALSRQVAANAFLAEFNGKDVTKEAVAEWMQTKGGMPATPHSQRSYAHVGMQIVPGTDPELEILITAIENKLQTPVQATVKRVDEQAFAERNGGNLMFSEDAARLIKAALDPIASITSYYAEVRHEESLHPHDAVAVVVG